MLPRLSVGVGRVFGETGGPGLLPTTGFRPAPLF
jgi:hypothetical protein